MCGRQQTAGAAFRFDGEFEEFFVNSAEAVLSAATTLQRATSYVGPSPLAWPIVMLY